MMEFENLENVETVDIYPLYVFSNLDKLLSSHGHTCIEVENGMLVYFDFKESNGRVAVLIANQGDSFKVLAPIPIRDDVNVLYFCLDLFRELNLKMRKDKEYGGCYTENDNNEGINVYRDVLLSKSKDVDVDVANIFKAATDVCSLVLRFNKTMLEMSTEYEKSNNYISEKSDIFDYKTNEESSVGCFNGCCLVIQLLFLAFVLVIIIAVAIEGWS